MSFYNSQAETPLFFQKAHPGGFFAVPAKSILTIIFLRNSDVAY